MSDSSKPSPAQDFLTRLPYTPDVCVHNVDAVRSAVLLVGLNELTYRTASFLDDRVLHTGIAGAWLPMEPVIVAISEAVQLRPLHFIFHTGHVGSTLISRLLGECTGVLSLREPLALRTIADLFDVRGRPDSLLSVQQLDQFVALLLRAWRRGYANTTAVVLKATSSAGRMASYLLASTTHARAIYVNLRLEPYLATLLAGANSLLDLRGHAAGRFRRLQSRIQTSIGPLHTLTPGELAALSWLSETLAQQDCVQTNAGRVVAVDFDEFLADVPASLDAVRRHLFESVISGPDAGRVAAVLATYSKAPDVSYSAALRNELLLDARSRHAAEIRRAIVWIQTLARLDKVVAGVVEQAVQG